MHAKFEGENLKIERAVSILVKWVSIMWSNLNVKSLGYVSGLRNISLACDQNVLYRDVKRQSYVMGQHSNFQHSF
jgi:hypothetical protein